MPIAQKYFIESELNPFKALDTKLTSLQELFSAGLNPTAMIDFFDPDDFIELSNSRYGLIFTIEFNIDTSEKMSYEVYEYTYKFGIYTIFKNIDFAQGHITELSLKISSRDIIRLDNIRYLEYRNYISKTNTKAESEKKYATSIDINHVDDNIITKILQTHVIYLVATLFSISKDKGNIYSDINYCYDLHNTAYVAGKLFGVWGKKLRDKLSSIEIASPLHYGNNILVNTNLFLKYVNLQAQNKVKNSVSASPPLITPLNENDIQEVLIHDNITIKEKILSHNKAGYIVMF